MTDICCALSEQCLVIKEGKKQKRFTRAITCQRCERQFHSYCCNWHDKNEADFNKDKFMFACKRCENFISAVADLIYGRVNALFVDLHKEIADLKETNLILSAKVASTAPANIVENESIISIKNNETSPMINNASLNMKTNEQIINKELTLPTTISNQNKNENANNINDDNSQDDDAENIEHLIYVCGIESSLTLEDIRFILPDYGVNIEGINLVEVDGNFRSKRYVKACSNNKIALFKFKNSINNSQLKNTWFVRDTPPRQAKHIIDETIQNKVVNLNVEYKNLSRDKILLKHNGYDHSFSNGNNNKIQSKSVPISIPFKNIAKGKPKVEIAQQNRKLYSRALKEGQNVNNPFLEKTTQMKVKR